MGGNPGHVFMSHSTVAKSVVTLAIGLSSSSQISTPFWSV